MRLTKRKTRKAALDFALIKTDAKIWRETAELVWQRNRKGKTLPLTDIASLSAKRKPAPSW